MKSINPRDIIAILALIVCAILLLSGINGEITALMGVIIGYYFRGGQQALIPKSDYDKSK